MSLWLDGPCLPIDSFLCLQPCHSPQASAWGYRPDRFLQPFQRFFYLGTGDSEKSLKRFVTLDDLPSPQAEAWGE